MTDRRHWITNPAGHRALAQEFKPTDGDIVQTAFGEAVMIVPPDPDINDWICDVCTEPILTRWGDEPFPVPTAGSNALCNRCHQLAERVEGPWPGQSCGCDACRNQTNAWVPQLARALGITPR